MWVKMACAWAAAPWARSQVSESAWVAADPHSASPGQTFAEAMDVEATSEARLNPSRVRFFPGVGPLLEGGVLLLEGAGWSPPLWLELEGFEGTRTVERVSPARALAFLTRGEAALIGETQIRLSAEGAVGPWMMPSLEDGDPAAAGLDTAWPSLREGAAYVPAGRFRTPGSETQLELTQGDQLATQPVTNRQFLTFVEKSGYRPESSVEFLKHHRPGEMPEEFWDHPVIYVNQADAEACCRYYGGTLPSAHLWERAAMGWDARAFPWGDRFDHHRLNSREGRRGWTLPVGRYPAGAGPYGHQELAGGIWEWTATLDPEPDHAVLKGGAWVNGVTCVSNAYRAQHRVQLRAFYIGFRVAWALPVVWEG